MISARTLVGPTQSTMFVVSGLADEPSVYNLPLALRLCGVLDVQRLTAALEIVASRHDAFRMAFSPSDEGVEAHIGSSTRGVLLEQAVGVPERAWQRAAEALVAVPFDLSRPPLFRATLLLHGDRVATLVLIAHHLIWDGWSWAVFTRELGAAYTEGGDRRGSAPGPAEDSYLRYLRNERELGDEGESAGRRAFWRERLAGLAPAPLGGVEALELSIGERYAYAPLTFEAGVGRELTALATSASATPFMATLTAFKVLVARYAGDYDVAVTVPVSRRHTAGLEPAIGCMMHPIVVRTRLERRRGFVDAVRRVRRACLDSYENAEVSADVALADAGAAAKPGSLPLLAFHNTPDIELRLGDLQATIRPLPTPVGVQQLVVNVVPGSRWWGNVGLGATARDNGLDATTLARHLSRLLANGPRNPRCPLEELPLLSSTERAEAIGRARGPRLPIGDDTVVDLFDRRVSEDGRRLALVAHDRRVSYAELGRLVDAVTARLAEMGVEEDSVVGACLDRGVDLFATVLGTWRLGATYLPLDPTFPIERLTFMLRDSGAQLVIGDDRARRLLASAGIPVIEPQDPPAASDWDRPSRARGDADAYVLYTSGSTGVAKGVVGRHRAVAGRVLDNPFPFEADERCCHKTSSSFVDSLWEMFAPLAHGIPCVIADTETARDPVMLLELLSRERVTRLMFVPTLLQALLESGVDLAAKVPALRWWISGGEPLAVRLAAELKARLPDARLLNIYGATECWDAAWHEYQEERQETGRVPIGRPLANTEVHVLDNARQPLPPGVAGELCVGGYGVARSYVGQPELTRQRFVPNPFGGPNAVLYRTGDRGRLRRDDTIEHLGRMDEQLKVRGYRIEPVEVELALRDHPSVVDAVVTASDDGQRLLAHVVPESELSAHELRTALKRRLPAYMIPTAFVPVAALPMTPTGKVDRKRLPRAPDAAGPRRRYMAPTTPMQGVVTDVWAQTLGVERVGLEDDFFELGGDSLRAQAAAALLRRRSNRDVKVAMIFEAPTAIRLSTVLQHLPPLDGDDRIPRM